jgi:hypothetical protein
MIDALHLHLRQRFDLRAGRIVSMRRIRSHAILLLGALALVPALQGTIVILDNEAITDFPEAIDFSLRASSDLPIESVHLEFGTDEQACQETVQRAVPEDFSPGTEVEVDWNWNLRQAGSLPPGTLIWWQWTMEDSAGKSLSTEQQSLRFIDHTFGWRITQAGNIKLHSYQGSASHAAQLLSAGQDALLWIEDQYGFGPSSEIDIFIYAAENEMRESTLFAPAWSGGLAFPTHSVVIIAIGEDELDWGIGAVAHELSHVAVGQFTLSCVNSTPPWVDEGLAMVAEGSVRPYHAELLASAIERDELHSVRELGVSFSAVPELASLAYAQSRSIVEFLLEQGGKQDLVALLEQFRAGDSEDTALRTVYDLDRDQLEVAWRDWVGAQPPDDLGQHSAIPTSTTFPTLQPITAGTSVATSEPTETPQPTEAEPTSSSPSDSLCAGLAAFPLIGLIWIRSTARIRRPHGKRMSRQGK